MADIPSYDPPLSRYELLRREVLFDIWSPGPDALQLRAVVCGACGFACYSPRPSAAEIDAKYEHLKAHEVDIGGSGLSRRGIELDRERAKRTRSEIVRELGKEPTGVLDVGGGDGKLLEPFAEKGVACYLIDYNPHPRRGAERLGETLDDLPTDARFDAVLFSHVLEHVAEPRALLAQALTHVEPGGVIFTEVPLEIWRGLPIHRDPVTHVNFFTRGSLADLHERAGFQVCSARAFRGSYGATRKRVATVVARPGSTSAPQWTARGVGEAAKVIRPAYAARLSRALRERPGRLRRRVLVRLGRADQLH